MRLHLPFAPPWVIKEAPDGQRAAILPAATGNLPAAIVTYGRIIIKPDEPRRWLEQVIRDDTPNGTRVELGRTIDHKTASDWPLRLVEAVVVDGKGTVVEARLCAFYTFWEHGAVAIVRAADRARLEEHGKLVLAVLEGGRPDWHGDPICLADAWDLDAAPPAPLPRPRVDTTDNDPASATALADVERAIATSPSAMNHGLRGELLLALGRPADAIAAFDAALELAPDLEPAHYYLGTALGMLGRHLEAITAWDRALALAPGKVDTLYNIAQAKFLLRDYEGALAGFEGVVRLDANDLLSQRKVIQCLYALGRHDEGERARAAFRVAWQTSKDPRARLITEYVFDQFEGDGFSVHAFETLRVPNPAIHTLFVFRAIEMHGDHDHPLPASVLVETSDQAKSAGTPFVLAVQAGRVYRVLGAAPALPPYATLKTDVARLLGEALAK